MPIVTGMVTTVIHVPTCMLHELMLVIAIVKKCLVLFRAIHQGMDIKHIEIIGNYIHL